MSEAARLGLDGLEGRDRRCRGVVPQDLPVLLEEVGISLRVDDDRVDRSIVDLDTLLTGGFDQGGRGFRFRAAAVSERAATDSRV